MQVAPIEMSMQPQFTPTTVRGRFQLAAAALAVALLLPGLSGWWSTQELAISADLSVRRAIASQGLSARFVIAALHAARTGQSYVSTPSRALERDYREYGQQAHDIARALNRDVAGSADEVEAIASLDGHLSDLQSNLARAHRHTDLAEPDSASRYLAATAPLEAAMLHDVSILGAAEATDLSTATARLRDAGARQAAVFFGVFAMVVVVAALIAHWLSRTVTRPLSLLVVQADALAARRTAARIQIDDMPSEFRALAIAMNGAGESLIRLAEAETVASRNQRLALVGQLASGVAHELNNPLHTILLTVGVLQENVSDPQLRYELDVIRAQAARAREIVRDLTGTARTGVEAREIVPADSVVRRAADELTRLAAAHGAALTIQFPSHSLSSIAVNREALTRVLGILVTNAAQASAPGSNVTLRAEEDAGGCRYIVEDDGPGIASDVLARLFEPFFTTKLAGEGTGLGLSVAQDIAASHQGKITAENRVRTTGKGARFTVRIPRVGGDRALPHHSPAPQSLPFASSTGSLAVSATPHGLPEEAPTPLRSAGDRLKSEIQTTPHPRALVVDDEPTIRSVVARILARVGWRVDEASDGTTALALIGTAEKTGESYGLILSDLRMPTMSGIELHDALAMEYPKLLERFCVISGDLTSPDVVEFMRRTMCRVMEKPLDITALQRVAEEARSGWSADG